MTCERCARPMDADSSYCRFCGAAVGTGSTWTGRRLARLPAEGRIAGVCAGIAEYLRADVALVRLVWAILTVVPGALIGGVLAYAGAWLLLPEAAPDHSHSGTRRLYRSGVNRKLAGVCGGLAAYFGVDATAVRLLVVVLTIYPGAIVFGLIGYALAWFIIPPAPSATLHSATSPA